MKDDPLDEMNRVLNEAHAACAEWRENRPKCTQGIPIEPESAFICGYIVGRAKRAADARGAEAVIDERIPARKRIVPLLDDREQQLKKELHDGGIDDCVYLGLALQETMNAHDYWRNEAIIRREHATPAQVEGRMSDVEFDRLDNSMLRIESDTFAYSYMPIRNEALRARASETTLLARAEADASKFAQAVASWKAEEKMWRENAEADARRIKELEARVANRCERVEELYNELGKRWGQSCEWARKYESAESELARLRDHLHEEHCCNCDEAARQGLAPSAPGHVKLTPEQVALPDLDAETPLSGASGEKAWLCGTCGGRKIIKAHNWGDLRPNGDTFPCPDCNGTGQTPEARQAGDGRRV